MTSSLLRHRKNVTKLTSQDFSFWVPPNQNFWLYYNHNEKFSTPNVIIKFLNPDKKYEIAAIVLLVELWTFFAYLCIMCKFHKWSHSNVLEYSRILHMTKFISLN